MVADWSTFHPSYISCDSVMPLQCIVVVQLGWLTEWYGISVWFCGASGLCSTIFTCI